MKIYKLIYQCDGCGIEIEDADQIRSFTGEVTNGNNTKSFIRPEQIFCINCLQFALDYKNETPETVIIKEESIDQNYNNNNNNINLIASRVENLEEFKKETLEYLEHIAKNIEKTTSAEKVLSDKLFQIEKILSNIQNYIEPIETLKESPVENQEEFPDEIETKTSDDKINSLLESNSSNEDQSDMTYDKLIEQIVNSDIFQNTGDYLVLCQIKNSQIEEYFAKEKCGYENVTSLREACGKSLINNWFSTGKYISEKDINNSTNYSSTEKVINKIVFGIPNIVDRTIIIPKIENGYGYILKNDFDIQIESPPKYEVPEEIDNNKTTIQDISTETVISDIEPVIKKDPVKNIDSFLKPKKKFSKFNIDDEYI